MSDLARSAYTADSSSFAKVNELFSNSRGGGLRTLGHVQETSRFALLYHICTLEQGRSFFGNRLLDEDWSPENG